MAGIPRARQERLHFRLGHFPRVDARETASFAVHLHHAAVRLGRRFLEERLQHLDDEVHRRVVVVEQDHAVERRLLRLAANALLDRAVAALVAARTIDHTHRVAHMAGWSTSPERVGPSRYRFPAADEMPDGDLVGVGGDLEPDTLVHAYRHGIFPMEVTGLPGVIGWWSPDPRGVLPVDGMRITRSLRQSAKRFSIRVDTCFDAVIRACADPSREDGWITDDFVAAYSRLHAMGWAHSVEVFDRDGRLAGGLYGVAIGGL